MVVPSRPRGENTQVLGSRGTEVGIRLLGPPRVLGSHVPDAIRFGGVLPTNIFTRTLPELMDSLRVEAGRLIRFTCKDPGGLIVGFRHRPEAWGAWALVLPTPPMARSGALQEAPDFTATVSHGRQQMVQRVSGRTLLSIGNLGMMLLWCAICVLPFSVERKFTSCL